MMLLSLLSAALTVATFSSAQGATIAYDKVQPFAQPEPVTASEKTALKFKPSLHVIRGCLPYPAVNDAGEVSGGLEPEEMDFDSSCQGSALGSQVYGRVGRYNELWAIMYAWYVPKWQTSQSSEMKGHRHNWLTTIVWLKDPGLEEQSIAAVACSMGGDYDFLLHKTSDGKPFAEHFNGLSPQITYEAERQWLWASPFGAGELQDLIMWKQLSEQARAALSNAEFGEQGKVPFVDANFNAQLEAGYPALDSDVGLNLPHQEALQTTTNAQ